MALAALDRHAQVYLLGFDMGPTETDRFNNIYAGAEFYKAAGAHPTYTGNWRRQVAQVAEDFPSLQFVRVQGSTTAPVPEFHNIKNFSHVPISQFLEQLNNG